MTGTVHHKKRRGGPYNPKPPISEEERQHRSLAMKEFNRRTGKVTTIGNFITGRMRQLKLVKK